MFFVFEVAAAEDNGRGVWADRCEWRQSAPFVDGWYEKRSRGRREALQTKERVLTNFLPSLSRHHPSALSAPAAINSKYDPQTPETSIDYSYTAPLDANGDNYLCKGYNTATAYETLSPVATLTAGGNLEVMFASGGTTHNGGSCQFSIRCGSFPSPFFSSSE